MRRRGSERTARPAGSRRSGSQRKLPRRTNYPSLYRCQSMRCINFLLLVLEWCALILICIPHGHGHVDTVCNGRAVGARTAPGNGRPRRHGAWSILANAKKNVNLSTTTPARAVHCLNYLRLYCTHKVKRRTLSHNLQRHTFHFFFK